MVATPEKDSLTPTLRERIALLRRGGIHAAHSAPGRFFKDADVVRLQRYCIEENCVLFRGHFPGKPVFPALGHILLARDAAERIRGNALFIATIGHAKFMSLVEPNAELEIALAQSRRTDGVWLFQIFDKKDGGAVEAARIKLSLR